MTKRGTSEIRAFITDRDDVPAEVVSRTYGLGSHGKAAELLARTDRGTDTASSVAEAIQRWDLPRAHALLPAVRSAGPADDPGLVVAGAVHLLDGRLDVVRPLLARAGHLPEVGALSDRVRSWGGETRDPALLTPGDCPSSGWQDVVLLAASVAGTVDLLARSRYREALHHACVQTVVVLPGLRSHMLPALAEAAARVGHQDLAAHSCTQLEGVVLDVGGAWAEGVLARTRAVAHPGGGAEDQHRLSLDLLGGIGASLDLARSRLLYGEWLRRERRRSDAVAQLRAAAEDLHVLGIVAFDQRIETELAAAGERRSGRPAHGADLTAQERAVAERARSGLTNREIATELFISSATVTYHLQKVFSKLGIRSRRHLGSALAEVHGHGAHDG